MLPFMNTRRNFIVSSSLASLSLCTTKPFETVASGLRRIPGFTLEPKRVNIVSPGMLTPGNRASFEECVRSLRCEWKNLVIVKANQSVSNNINIRWDTTVETIRDSNNDYQVVTKGNVKMGVISIAGSEDYNIEKVNTIAAHLKREKKCHLVICLSQLGLKQKNKPDDLQLAAASSCIDVILGGDASNTSPHPRICFNKHKKEVIVQTGCSTEIAAGNIEVHFDDNGNKTFVDIKTIYSSC